MNKVNERKIMKQAVAWMIKNFPDPVPNFPYYAYNMEKKNFHSAKGISRICLMPKDLPFVIKVEYNGRENRCCEQEMVVYKKACKLHLDSYFAKVYGKFAHNDLICYVYEKIKITYYNLRDQSRDVYEEITGRSILYQPSNYTFEYAIPEDDRKQLFAFIGMNDIGDLHLANIGFCSIERKLVIIDYAPPW